MRTFTVEDANRSLPRVRQLVIELVTASRLVPELDADLALARYLAAREPGSATAAERVAEARERRERAKLDAYRTVAELEDLGVSVKDPIEGLVDFPSHRNGVPVELCWKLGEPSVGHWHEIGAGYAGRQPLEETSTNS